MPTTLSVPSSSSTNPPARSEQFFIPTTDVNEVLAPANDFVASSRIVCLRCNSETEVERSGDFGASTFPGPRSLCVSCINSKKLNGAASLSCASDSSRFGGPKAGTGESEVQRGIRQTPKGGVLGGTAGVIPRDTFDTSNVYAQARAKASTRLRVVSMGGEGGTSDAQRPDVIGKDWGESSMESASSASGFNCAAMSTSDGGGRSSTPGSRRHSANVVHPTPASPSRDELLASPRPSRTTGSGVVMIEGLDGSSQDPPATGPAPTGPSEAAARPSASDSRPHLRATAERVQPSWTEKLRRSMNRIKSMRSFVDRATHRTRAMDQLSSFKLFQDTNQSLGHDVHEEIKGSTSAVNLPGMVPTDEWIQAAKYDETLFSTMNPNVLNALVERFRALDGDSDQYLSFEEFCVAFSLPVSSLSKKLFELYDKDNDGRINVFEFVQELTSRCQPDFDAKERIMQLADLNGDGRIQHEEIVAILAASHAYKREQPSRQQLEAIAWRMIQEVTKKPKVPACSCFMPKVEHKRVDSVSKQKFLRMCQIYSDLIFPLNHVLGKETTMGMSFGFNMFTPLHAKVDQYSGGVNRFRSSANQMVKQLAVIHNSTPETSTASVEPTNSHVHHRDGKAG